MEGRDLFEYFKSRKFQVSEKRIKDIAYQIGEGL
jgi:hypothetical protein